MGTALEVEGATVVPLKQRPLQPLQGSPIYLALLVLSLPLDPNLHLIDVLIGTDNLSAVFIVISLFVDSLTIDLLFLVGAIVLQILKFLLNFLLILVTITFLAILILLLVLLICQLLQYLHVLSRGVLIERLAPIMYYVDLPQAVDYVAVVERPVRVKYEHLHTRLRRVVPHAALVDEASTVDKEDAAHEGVAFQLLELLHHVHVGEDRDAIVLHLI